MDTLIGYIENIVYTQEENGFTVARLKSPTHKDLLTITGPMPSIQPGETLCCKGSWKIHPHHGRQFEVISFDTQAPSDLIGIRKYLESGLIKGIGPAYAERIVKTFGLSTLDIIDKTPEMLSQVPGLGSKRLENIRICWQEQKSIRDVMIFLRGHGVSAFYAQKIFKTYREHSIDKVRSNPYALAKDIFGIGFKTADKIAQGLGIPLNSSMRIDAGIEHILWEFTGEGHTCFSQKGLIEKAADALGIAENELELRISTLIGSGSLVRNDELIWVKPLFLAELGIAKELSRLKQSSCQLRTVQVEKAIDWIQQNLRITLAEEQVGAVVEGLTQKIMIITGGPGTGKSTITKAILKISEKLTSNILLAAPTGKAAKRMTEITYKKAFTIHSLLEMDFSNGKFKRNRENPLKCDLLIVDESSMIDTLLMFHLLKAIPSHARVIFIGDIDQLPSVGAGNVLRDIIESNRICVSTLKQIFRQAAHSKIITNAHKINQGLFPDTFSSAKSDFIFIEKQTPEEILTAIIENVQTIIPTKYRFNRFDDIQVLSPMKKGIIGGENLNHVLQKALNPSTMQLTRMGRNFQVSDKVMQIRNNYQKEVYNGDVGRITDIDLAEQSLIVSFDGRLVSYEFHEIDELVLAYAVSIHKYQGSECPCIIIPVHTSHFKLLNKNLLYTGVTRGKKLVILIGTKKALAIAVRNEDVQKRYTGLKNRIQENV